MTAMLYRLQLARSERVPAKTERGKGITRVEPEHGYTGGGEGGDGGTK